MRSKVFRLSADAAADRRCFPLPPHVGHRRSSSVPFSTTPSPLQSGQVFMCGSCACYHSPLMGAPDSICRASGSGTCSPTNPIAPLWARAPRNSGVEPRPSGAAITGYHNPRRLVSTVRKAINLLLAIVPRFHWRCSRSTSTCKSL